MTRSGACPTAMLQALLAGSGEDDRVALLLEGVLDPAGHRVLVFDDQDRGGHRVRCYTGHLRGP